MTKKLKMTNEDWAKFDAMTEEELEQAIAADPDWADIPRDWYKHAKAVYPDGGKALSVKVDADVARFIESSNLDYQTFLSGVMKSFVESQQPRPQA